MNYRVGDLFSGSGGASAGFAAHGAFKLVFAADAERGKPSIGSGKTECNKTYEANIGLRPMQADLGVTAVEEILEHFSLDASDRPLDVLISCAPCTGFSRTVRKSLVVDDDRNSLVRRTADFAKRCKPTVIIMENVGELLLGKFSRHFEGLSSDLKNLGYEVSGEIHSLEQFGLAQSRKRALVIATKKEEAPHRTLSQLWSGFSVDPSSVTVRNAISHLPPIAAGEAPGEDRSHIAPAFTKAGLRRIQLIPHDGGDWPSLLSTEEGRGLLTPTMKRYSDAGRVGPYRDVYGRLWWDRPAVTIKRECAHIGNGRYGHPEQDRLCTVREMGALQGFPYDYEFVSGSLSNAYRHVGDAVPPLISYQLAHLVNWILSGRRPDMAELALKNVSFKSSDIREARTAKGAEKRRGSSIPAIA